MGTAAVRTGQRGGGARPQRGALRRGGPRHARGGAWAAAATAVQETEGKKGEEGHESVGKLTGLSNWAEVDRKTGIDQRERSSGEW